MSVKDKIHTDANKPGRHSAETIQVWADDPGSGMMIHTALPDLARRPLAYNFTTPQLPPTTDTRSAAFRYWTAAAALRRGADFWAPRVVSGQWQPGPALSVNLDEGADLNAYYDRTSLNFFHGATPTGMVYSGASPDVVCHEMGHAVLDAIKPQLWGAASHEAAAFHESFGDMSAILCALQVREVREAVLKNGQSLYRSSSLSRLAEELGAAIRARYPDAVDPDCLRNACNTFVYSDPLTLPSGGPASQISSEAHSFSRIFTGAFFEALSGLLRMHAGPPSLPTADQLAEVSLQMRDILARAIIAAPVVPNFFAQVAAAMVVEAGRLSAQHAAVFKGVFARRAILSLQSASDVQSLQEAHFNVVSASGTSDVVRPLDEIALSAFHYGLDRPLVVETASHPRGYAAFSATPDEVRPELTSASKAAAAYVDTLFARSRVDYNSLGRDDAAMAGRRHVKTHKIFDEGGALRLRRICFD